MRLLLDTHVLLWYATDDPRLSARARRALDADDSELVVSVASIWELAIKAGLKQVTLPLPLPELVAALVRDGYRILSIEWTHAAAVESLPPHHRDPFDRLLVAQASLEQIPLVSGDAALAPYKVRRLW